MGHNNSALIVFWQRDYRIADVCSHHSISLVLANHKSQNLVRRSLEDRVGRNNDDLIVCWQKDYRIADVCSHQSISLVFANHKVRTYAGGLVVDTGCTVGLNNVPLQGTVSSILLGASAVALELAAAPGGNLRLVGASGAELFELVSRQLVIGTAVG